MRVKFSNGSLPGTDTKAYRAIQEAMTPYSAVCEFFHNSIEHGAASRFQFDCSQTENGTYRIKICDDGKGMGEKAFKLFINRYQSHIQAESVINNSSISEFGMGMKDACIYFSNPALNAISRCIITSYCEDGNSYQWVWDICASNAPKGKYGETIEEISNPEMKRGLHIIIDNAKPMVEKTVESIKKELAKSFTTEKRMPATVISFGGSDLSDKLHWVDPMHFELFPTLNFGDKEYSFRNGPDGNYITKEVIFFKKTIKAENRSEANPYRKEVTIPLISVYFNREYWNKTHKNSYDELNGANSGIFALKGNTYIERGNNTIPMVEHIPNRGGGCRLRQCVILDDTNSFIFNIKSMKMNGIEAFPKNHYLNELYVCENGKTIYENIRDEYARITTSIHKWVRNNSRHDNYENGFPSQENFNHDYEEYLKENQKPVKKKYDEDESYMPSPKSQLYSLDEDKFIINRTVGVNEDFLEAVDHSMKSEIPDDITREDILYSVFDTLAEIEISPKQYQEFAEILSDRIHHYE